MSRKSDVGDLDDTASSVGGAIGQWPYRTITWHCRKIQENRENVEAMEALYEKDIKDLEDLEYKARDMGIGTSELSDQIEKLRETNADVISDVIRSEYRQLYDMAKSDGGVPSVGKECPYEETGMDKSCWSCPLSGNVMEEL